MNSTVVGASGFIGRHLARRLRDSECWLPQRDDPRLFERPLGCVYYCAGLTADFRTRPYATVDAHVGLLRQMLEKADFDTLVYLSSTRVYSGSDSAFESQALLVSPGSPDHLYNVSKLMGESLALSSGRPCKVVRLSNVLGPDMGDDNFVGTVLAEARRCGHVHFQTALTSSKDYLWVDDVVAGLITIAGHGRHPIYNLAAGRNTSHAELAGLLDSFGVTHSVATNAPSITFPPISIARLQAETGFAPAATLDRLADWLATQATFPTPQL